MRASLFFIAILFSVLSVTAQKKQDKFVINDDLIQATLHHDNGVVAQTGFYNKKGELQGEWTSYNTEGAKTTIANYLNGEKVGTWLFFEGNKIKEVTYSNAKIAKVKTLAVSDVYIANNR